MSPFDPKQRWDEIVRQHALAHAKVMRERNGRASTAQATRRTLLRRIFRRSFVSAR